MFRNFGQNKPDVGETPKRKHTEYWKRRKFKIKKYLYSYFDFDLNIQTYCDHPTSNDPVSHPSYTSHVDTNYPTKGCWWRQFTCCKNDSRAFESTRLNLWSPVGVD
jgi:hypothetical protein